MVYRAQAKHNCRPRQTVQTLGEHSYAIPEVAARESTLAGKLVPIVALLFFPVTLLATLLFSGIMFFGPTSWRHAIVSRVIPTSMKTLAKRTENQRKLLLQHVSGRVLDVGCGGGGYMSLLKGKATHIVALEPVTEMHHIIRQQAKEAGFDDYQITILKESVEEYAASNPPASFDWVILGNVMCEVDNQESTLRHIHKLLKNGGCVYFCEHLGAPTGSFARSFQNMVNPWWRTVSGGCNCNRDSLHAIEGMADWDVVSWQMNKLKVFMVPMVMGLAQKAQPMV